MSCWIIVLTLSKFSWVEASRDCFWICLLENFSERYRSWCILKYGWTSRRRKPCWRLWKRPTEDRKYCLSHGSGTWTFDGRFVQNSIRTSPKLVRPINFYSFFITVACELYIFIHFSPSFVSLVLWNNDSFMGRFVGWNKDLDLLIELRDIAKSWKITWV